MERLSSSHLIFFLISTLVFTGANSIGPNNFWSSSSSQPSGAQSKSESGGGAHLRQPQKQWCVPKGAALEPKLKKNLDWLCGTAGVDCNPIKPGGACFEPNTIRSHASYAMNSYFQKKGYEPVHCSFEGTGLITISDPSHGKCTYE